MEITEYKNVQQSEVWNTLKAHWGEFRTVRLDLTEEGTVNIYTVAEELIEIEG